VLFGLLGLAVPARAFLLCWSMDLLGGGDRGRVIFGPYFVVPFGLAVAVLLLEVGLVSWRRGVLGFALAAPVGLVGLSLVGSRPDPIYQEFRDAFAARLGGDPLWVTLLAAAGFYAYSALRRVPLAVEALTAALLALAVVGPDTLSRGEFIAPLPVPLLAAAAVQLGLGIRRRSSWRCLAGSLGLVAVAALALPEEAPHHGLILLHLVLTVVLVLGAAFDDALGGLLRATGLVLAMLACLAALVGRFQDPAGLSPLLIGVYPLAMAAILAGYALLLRHQPSFLVVGLIVVCWLTAVGWEGYVYLRQIVAGLDQIALSMALFALAILISLGKAGLLSRWLAEWRGAAPPAAGLPGAAGLNPAQGTWREGRSDSPDAVQQEPGRLPEET
jgi:hypothetical protein